MTVNDVTARYLDRCATDGDPLRDAVRRATYRADFARGTGAGLLSRPFFVPDATIRAVADDVMAVYELIASLPDRLFAGDLGRYCAALGLDEPATRIVRSGGSAKPPRYGRADLLFDGSGYRVLELNIGSELGGCHIGEMNRALLRLPEFVAFADEHQLINVDPAAEIADALRRIAAPVTGRRDPVVALLEWTGGFATVPFLYRLFQEIVDAYGITVHLAEAPQVVNKDGKLHLAGQPIDVVLRYFMLHEASSDPGGEQILEPILRAHAEGGTILFTHPQTNLYSYKDNLAFLSDPRYRDAFTAEEGALIDRMLPMTRLVDDGRTEVDGESVNVRDYCLAHRETLIAKPHAGFGSYGTVAGWEATDDVWAALIANSAPNGYIVQRRVDGELEQALDPVTGDRQDWLPIHGVYFTDQGYGGDYVRALPAGRTAVISGGTGAVITGVFSYPDTA